MTDEERQYRGLTVEDHIDAFADCSPEETARVEAWLRNPPPAYYRALAMHRGR